MVVVLAPPFASAQFRPGPPTIAVARLASSADVGCGAVEALPTPGSTGDVEDSVVVFPGGYSPSPVVVPRRRGAIRPYPPKHLRNQTPLKPIIAPGLMTRGQV